METGRIRIHILRISNTVCNQAKGADLVRVDLDPNLDLKKTDPDSTRFDVKKNPVTTFEKHRFRPSKNNLNPDPDTMQTFFRFRFGIVTWLELLLKEKVDSTMHDYRGTLNLDIQTESGYDLYSNTGMDPQPRNNT